jgi:cell division protein FtsB
MQKRLLITPALVIVFILFFTVFGERGLLRISHLHRDRDEIQKRFQELKDENDKLKREVAALQSDRRYLESIARRDFGLVRSNEVIYQFQSADKAAAPQTDKKVDAKGDKQAVAQPAQTQKR